MNVYDRVFISRLLLAAKKYPEYSDYLGIRNISNTLNMNKNPGSINDRSVIAKQRRQIDS